MTIAHFDVGLTQGEGAIESEVSPPTSEDEDNHWLTDQQDYSIYG